MGLFGFEVVKAGEGGQKFEKPPSLDLPYVKQRYFLIFFEMANHKTRSFEIWKANTSYTGPFKFWKIQ